MTVSITVVPPVIPSVIPYDATLTLSLALIVPVWLVKVSFALVSVKVISGWVVVRAIDTSFTVTLNVCSTLFNPSLAISVIGYTPASSKLGVPLSE